MKADEDSAKVTFPPPFVYLGFLLIGLVVDRIAGWLMPLTLMTRAAIAVPLIAGGILLLLSATGLFKRARTDVKPWKPVTEIVDTGIYGFTRNPMYLRMAGLYAGLAVGLRSIGALILLPVVITIIQTQVIAREERYLDAKFGEAYRAYKLRVRRWL